MLRLLNIGAKVALIGLLLLAVLRPDLPQFAGKAMGGRAATYPLAAVLIPLIWLVRGRRDRYPHLIDLLVVAPFLIDTAGNALDLYDSIDWWDDANHLVNWGILTAAFGQFLRMRPPGGRLVTAGLCLGFGCVTAVLWEFAEYITFIRNSPELDTAYVDTLGDLLLGGIVGSGVAAILTVAIRWSGPRRAVV